MRTGGLLSQQLVDERDRNRSFADRRRNAFDIACANVPGGAVCETGGGHCYKECATKADCPRDGYDCVGGPNEQGKMWCDVNGVGGACGTVADCTTGLDICNSDPGGQCTHDCTTQTDCDGIDGAVCETQRPGHCYKECTSKADCGPTSGRWSSRWGTTSPATSRRWGGRPRGRSCWR